MRSPSKMGRSTSNARLISCAKASASFSSELRNFNVVSRSRSIGELYPAADRTKLHDPFLGPKPFGPGKPRNKSAMSAMLRRRKPHTRILLPPGAQKRFARDKQVIHGGHHQQRPRHLADRLFRAGVLIIFLCILKSETRRRDLIVKF